MRSRPGTELVVLAREGSKAARCSIATGSSLAHRACGAADHGLTDDAGQEAFVKAFRELVRFDETQSFAVAR